MDGSSQDGNQMVMRTEKTGSILKVEPRRAAFADGLDMEGERKGRDKDSRRVVFFFTWKGSALQSCLLTWGTGKV